MAYFLCNNELVVLHECTIFIMNVIKLVKVCEFLLKMFINDLNFFKYFISFALLGGR